MSFTNYSYFFVEGVHDASVIGKIMVLNGMKQIKTRDKLKEFWDEIIPKTYPTTNKGSLIERVEIPFFYDGNLNDVNFSVAILPCGGIQEIPKKIKSTSLVFKKFKQLHSIAIVCDADNKTPNEQKEYIQKELDKLGVEIESKHNIFVFPDDKNSGTLENLLLDCGTEVYPDLKSLADQYIASASEHHPFTESGKLKAIVGSMGNVLKPGKANQVTIQDDEWISMKTLDVIEPLNNFILSVLS